MISLGALGPTHDSEEATRQPRSKISTRRHYVAEHIPLALGRLERLCLGLTQDELAAEDLVQSTCVRALERADQFEPGTYLDRWLASIARSIWLNEVKLQSRLPSHLNHCERSWNR